MTDSIGPTITPAEWAAANPLSVREAATIVLTVIGADLIDEATANLRESLIDETTPVEPEVTLAAQLFVRGYKAHRLFGDSLTEVTDGLRAALGDLPTVTDEPYLYILMRTDLASMNAGKAVAQGSHAANQMVFEARKRIAGDETTDLAKLSEFEDLLDEWENAANGFGTCIVLGVTEHEMRATVEAAAAAGLHAGITHDPSYPLRDGASFHLIPLDTCGYVFAKKSVASPFVGKFSLMP